MKFARAFPLAFVLAFAAVCSAQTVYVSGRNTDVVFRFDYATGSSEGPISGSGIDNPTGNVLDTPGHLYVGNSNTNSVLRFAADGTFIDTFASGISRLRDLVFGPGGDLFVAEGGGVGIRRFDGTTGASKGLFASGGGLTNPVGPDGNLYVSGPLQSAIYRFNGTTGAFIDVLWQGAPLANPSFMKFGPDQNLYVSSTLTNEVHRFNVFTTQSLGVFASGNGMNLPTGLMFTEAGNLLVGSQAPHSAVMEFDQNGVFVRDLTTALNGAVAGHAAGMPTSLSRANRSTQTARVSSSSTSKSHERTPERRPRHANSNGHRRGSYRSHVHIPQLEKWRFTRMISEAAEYRELAHDKAADRLEAVEKQRAALLDALRRIVELAASKGESSFVRLDAAGSIARAAIRKAEGKGEAK